MSEYSPHNRTFKVDLFLQKVSNIIYWIILVISILGPIIQKIVTNYVIVEVFEMVIMISIPFYFFVDSIQSLILRPLANSIRRNDFIDNSLGSKLSLRKSLGYYDNDNLKAGLYKLTCNLLENCFFTLELLKKQTIKILLVPTTFSILILVFAYCGFKQLSTSILIFQVFFSASIIGKAINHFILLSGLSNIQNSLSALFVIQDFKINDIKYESLILKNLLDYETLISRIQVTIPDKLFDEHNFKLSAEWGALKENKNI